MNKKKAVTKKEPKETAVTTQGFWGAGENIDNSDILIPKIRLMQQISQLVEDDKAKPGDFVNSLENNLLGSANKKLKAKKPIEFIAFNKFKTMQTFANGDYVKSEMWEPKLAALPFNEVIDGANISRRQVLHYYVLLPSEIKEGVAFPYVISFKSMSMPTGKKLETYFAKLKAFKKPSAVKTYILSAHETKNDKGTFYVLDVDPGRNSTVKEIEASKSWYDALKAAKSVSVDESEDSEEVTNFDSSKLDI